jgi:hypothetical protein
MLSLVERFGFSLTRTQPDLIEATLDLRAGG